MTRMVDRSLARAIAYKRIFTGSLGLLGGAGMLVAGVSHGETPPLLFVAVLLFWGGGAWALRDGIRLRALLAR